MKRILSALLTLMLVFSLCACQKGVYATPTTHNQASEPPKSDTSAPSPSGAHSDAQSDAPKPDIEPENPEISENLEIYVKLEHQYKYTDDYSRMLCSEYHPNFRLAAKDIAVSPKLAKTIEQLNSD